MTKILNISDGIKINKDNLDIEYKQYGYHNSGDSLKVTISNPPCILLILDGNSNYYMGGMLYSKMIKLASSNTYDSSISYSNKVITMPTSGTYYWMVV